MRDTFSCFSERSVLVSPANGCIAPTTSSSVPAVRNVVTSLYRSVLSTQKQLLITVTWIRAHLGQDLHISFGDCAAVFKLGTCPRFLRKKKGSRTVETSASHIEVFWDFSAAKGEGPEPIDGFYVVAVVDSEIALVLGNISEDDAARKFIDAAGNSGGSCSPAGVRRSLISRQEHCRGNAIYATRAKFSESGPVHEILIRCSVGEGKKSAPALSVAVDRKVVMRMKRLQWNFRGNQTIFIDGLMVDLMWDLHGWFFSPAKGHAAVFMLRTRKGLDSRLWIEKNKEQDTDDFSLLIYGHASNCRAS